jgi:hypothetical protein
MKISKNLTDEYRKKYQEIMEVMKAMREEMNYTSKKFFVSALIEEFGEFKVGDIYKIDDTYYRIRMFEFPLFIISKETLIPIRIILDSLYPSSSGILHLDLANMRGGRVKYLIGELNFGEGKIKCGEVYSVSSKHKERKKYREFTISGFLIDEPLAICEFKTKTGKTEIKIVGLNDVLEMINPRLTKGSR